MGSTEYLVHSKQAHAAHILAVMLHTAAAPITGGNGFYDDGILRVRSIKIGMTRSIHGHDGDFLADSYMHGATVIGDNKLTAAHGSCQFANRKLPCGHKGRCFHLGNGILHHLPVHRTAKKTVS